MTNQCKLATVTLHIGFGERLIEFSIYPCFDDDQTAKRELSLVLAREQSIAPYTWSIDRVSLFREQPTRALANQNATSHLRQSGGMSVRPA